MRMATGRHGKLSEFNAGVVNVEDYKERFLLYCAANGLEDADKQKAVFLTCVGTATYTLLKNLVRPEKPQDKSLDELFVLLKSHFEPRIVVIVEIFRFISIFREKVSRSRIIWLNCTGYQSTTILETTWIQRSGISWCADYITRLCRERSLPNQS